VTEIARASTRKKAEALRTFYETPQRPLEITYSASATYPRYPYVVHDAGDAPVADGESARESTRPARSA